MKEKLKKNALWLIGEFFIFIVPLILLVILAFESKSSAVAFKLWGVVALIVITIVYYFIGKKQLNKRKEKAFDKVGYVPTWIRVLGLLVVMLPFVALILILQSASTMLKELYTYVGVTMGSVGLGYIFLIIDSYNKEKDRKKRIISDNI